MTSRKKERRRRKKKEEEKEEWNLHHFLKKKGHVVEWMGLIAWNHVLTGDLSSIF
jgi:hypothetical protein